MPRVLLTAYGPYEEWPTNASWLAIEALTRELPSGVELVTRRYPVDFAEVRRRLESDLTPEIDFAIHLGQAPGSGVIQLEALGINVARPRGEPADQAAPLVVGGPAAYRSQLPLEAWTQLLRSAGIPAVMSFHAGEYLCNAALYLSQHIAATRGLRTASVFLHVPLDPSQVIAAEKNLASLPAETTAAALRIMLANLPQLQLV